jgi:hypothetical protein
MRRKSLPGAHWRAGYTRSATGLFDPDNPADDRKHYIYRTDRQ